MIGGQNHQIALPGHAQTDIDGLVFWEHEMYTARRAASLKGPLLEQGRQRAGLATAQLNVFLKHARSCQSAPDKDPVSASNRDPLSSV